jgi:soluble lytic murein transglycosylase-like protein
MSDPNYSSPTVIQGWESLKQRLTVLVVLGLLAFSMLVLPAGRARLVAWSDLALEAMRPSVGRTTSVYGEVSANLTVEQQRVARWIANRHRVSLNRIEQLVEMSYQTAANYRLDPFLLLAVISVESGFNPYAESPVGAIGLMQIMPKIHEEKFKPFGGVSQALDPWVNMQVGAQILREYLDRFGTETDALRAYVGVGPTRETEYPNRIARIRERLVAASIGRALA